MTTTTTLPPSPPSTTSARRPSGAARTVLVVLGVIVALTGGGALAGGAVALWADQQRDGDGFFTAGPARFSTDTYAIAAPSVHVDMSGPGAFSDDDSLGEVRFQVASATPDGSVFVGIARADEVAAYLDQIGHDEVTDVDTGPFTVTYDRHPGGAPATDPAAQTFWATYDVGPGQRTVTWPIRAGDWAVVIMNGDASAGVEVDVSTGARTPVLGTVAAAALITGALLLIAGTVMVVAPLVSRRRHRPATTAG